MIKMISKINRDKIRRGKVLRGIPYLFLLLILFSCTGSEKRNNDKNSEEINWEVESGISVNDITLIAEQLADSILTSLTLEERIGQCLMPSMDSKSSREDIRKLKRYIEDYHVGGIVLMKGNTESAKILSEIGSKARIPLFIAIDAEWGLGMRLEDAPKYPKNGFINKDAGEEFLFDYGQRIAVECKDVGINMVLGPVIDVSSKGKGIIGNRAFSSDPAIVSDFGIAYAKGLESGGVISVAKHFPGHGGALNDSHEKIARLERNISDMDSLDLKPFRDYINSGLSGVMAGHIQAKALDPGGRVASVSIDMLSSLLREEMNFKGLILTDAFNMGGAKDLTAYEALKAGADIVLCPEDIAFEFENLINKVSSGQMDIGIINDRSKKILFYKILFHVIKS